MNIRGKMKMRSLIDILVSARRPREESSIKRYVLSVKRKLSLGILILRSLVGVD